MLSGCKYLYGLFLCKIDSKECNRLNWYSCSKRWVGKDVDHENPSCFGNFGIYSTCPQCASRWKCEGKVKAYINKEIVKA